MEAWELQTMVELTAPDIEHHFEEADDGPPTAWMLHRDGSWARAVARDDGHTTVHQSGHRLTRTHVGTGQP
ncbi:hypothetical protein [Streptosporangium canum]|uniref:hypothetical protein n=1 Tax=Streptosporangium canum TaxID=324952 RepID=UPI00379516F6